MANQQQPTEAELAILRVLWQQGPCTVREVHEALGGDQRTRYTTTLKQMQVMADKDLVARDDSQRSHVYAATVMEQTTEASIVNSFVQRVFDGSVQKMVLHALESDSVSDDDIAEIKRLLQQREKGK